MNPKDLFSLPDDDSIGNVFKVDSYSASVSVQEEKILRRIHVNGLVLLNTANPNMRLLGRISRVVRLEEELGGEDEIAHQIKSVVHIDALGTLRGPGGGREKVSFRRAVENLPEIGAKCFTLTDQRLSAFTGLINEEASTVRRPLTLGHYSLAPDAAAVLDGDAFFQRHAMVVGSTGSGKSWTVARIVEQAADLPSSNMVVFDLHGEYSPLAEHPNVVQYRIAGPGDLDNPGENVLFLPYWLLGYEDMLALILDRSDDNAPNQAMAFSKEVLSAKVRKLNQEGLTDELETFTIDSPVPYSLDDVYDEIHKLNEGTEEGARGPKKGPFNGRFDRFLPRLDAKRTDRRHGFLFKLGTEQLSVSYLEKLANKLMLAGSKESQGIKIIDFSEVPSDIIPIVISLVARLVFHIQQWTPSTLRHPIALVCDEAHLYLPARQAADAAEARALAHFERIAKEGRKYGVGLIIVSQRPSELNATIMSQCNNVVALRLANQSDKAAVANLLPENLGGILEILPTLDVGEAIVVGDACILPSRIRMTEPTYKPNSETVKFWTRWGSETIVQDLSQAVRSYRRQTSTQEIDLLIPLGSTDAAMEPKVSKRF